MTISIVRFVRRVAARTGHFRLHLLVAPFFTIAVLAACSGGSGGKTTPSLTASAGSPAATAVKPENEPSGFPIDPNMRLGLIVGARGSRSVSWGAGPTAESYTRNDQPADDPERANQSGWNCRTHLRFEGQPAVDWYVPVGTPVRATTSGTATLRIVTVANPFNHYRGDREPYLGNPDPTKASLSPFSGPSGGRGVFVRIENRQFFTEYAHIDLQGTLSLVAPDAFLTGFSRETNYAAMFGSPRDFRMSTPIARWTVRRGDVIAMSGESGYSEAPSLHYTVTRAGTTALRCPTAEAGFVDGAWLVK